MAFFEVDCFPSGPIIYDDSWNIIMDAQDKLNNDLSMWRKVKVPVSFEFINELTKVTKYEYRYRLYVSDVYERLGLSGTRWSGCYWEKDESGNMTDCNLP